MSMLDATLGANKAITKLEKDGRIAEVRHMTYNEYVSTNLEYEPEYGVCFGLVTGLNIDKNTLTTDDTFVISVREKPTDEWITLSGGSWIDETNTYFSGNGKIVGLEMLTGDTGESFCAAVLPDGTESYQLAVYCDHECEVEVKLTCTMTVVKRPIDPKYLPGVCLPVITFDSTICPASGYSTLADEEIVQIEALLESGVPAAILKCEVSAGSSSTATAAMTVFLSANNSSCYCSVPIYNRSYIIGNDNGSWKIRAW